MTQRHTTRCSTAIRLGLFGGSLLGLIFAVSASAHAADDLVAGASVTYQVPVEAPQGEVQILSLGVADLPVPSLIGSERFVHMRVAAHNRQDPQAWVLDPRDQFLDLPDGTPLAPRFAEASTGGAATPLVLTQGKRGYLDLFYPVGGFDPRWTSLTWRIRRGSDLIVARTVFERLPDTGWRLRTLPARAVRRRPSVLRRDLVFAVARVLVRLASPLLAVLRLSLRPPAGGLRRLRRRFTVELPPREHPRPAETVGSRWRGLPSGRPAMAPPAGAQPSTASPPTPVVNDPPAPPGDRSRWRWQLEQVLVQPPGDSAPPAPAVPGATAPAHPRPSPPPPRRPRLLHPPRLLVLVFIAAIPPRRLAAPSLPPTIQLRRQRRQPLAQLAHPSTQEPPMPNQLNPRLAARRPCPPPSALRRRPGRDVPGTPIRRLLELAAHGAKRRRGPTGRLSSTSPTRRRPESSMPRFLWDRAGWRCAMPSGAMARVPSA